ncbi:vacuolar protein sorting-associated protein 37B-like [Littorina saxatilis]|uniref:VPS37 C-terminal domain-containing protein n=1 Tax=Littorina saxatilis TaxID=31220 RepID=A0AAN9AKB1_9CAEN
MYNHYNSQYGRDNVSQHSFNAGVGRRSPQHIMPALNIIGRMDDTAALALLQHLDKDDLQHLLNDESKLNDLVQDLQQVRRVQSDHDELVAQNKSLAEYNLSLQPRLDSLKTEVATLYETVNRLKTDLGITKSRLDESSKSQNLDTIHALLQTAAAEAEEESEGVAEKLLDKETGLEEFLVSYIPCRKKAHMRRIKAEKMGELLRQGGHSSGWPQSGGTPNHNPQYPPGPSSAPYPVGSSSVPYPIGAAYGMPDPRSYRP